jgi:hypothetical protein
LLACENKALLVGWNSFLVLDFGLDIFNGITGFDFESNGFACESFNKDLHWVFLLETFFGLIWYAFIEFCMNAEYFKGPSDQDPFN